MPEAAPGAPAADLAHELVPIRARVEGALRRALPAGDVIPTRLHQAMAYASLDGGKRVRALLVFAAGRCVGASDALLDAPAVAVELMHAYSLVHDDLPCMDDDDLRRGKPSCHRAFDEATALLVGDALQARAFAALAEAALIEPQHRIEMVRVLAEASGSLGMAGGQAIDLASVAQRLDLDALETMHRMKTGALIRASVRLGAMVKVREGDPILDALDAFAASIGLAFQIQDDILDVEGSTEMLGKTQGADRALEKPTYPSLLGLEASRRRAAELHRRALSALEPLGKGAGLLRDLATFVVTRTS